METLVHSKYCKHCETHHPSTSEYWEFRDTKPYRCKIHRKQVYHKGGGKEKAQQFWASLTQEDKDELNAQRRTRYKTKKEDTVTP